MPIISAGAEAQEAERGWTSSPAGQASGQQPQSLPRGYGSVRPASRAHME